MCRMPSLLSASKAFLNAGTLHPHRRARLPHDCVNGLSCSLTMHKSVMYTPFCVEVIPDVSAINCEVGNLIYLRLMSAPSLGRVLHSMAPHATFNPRCWYSHDSLTQGKKQGPPPPWRVLSCNGAKDRNLYALGLADLDNHTTAPHRIALA